MSLRTSRVEGLPSDAIRLSEEEAIEFQWKIVKDWKDKNDVWFIRNGFGVLGVATSLSAIFIQNYYRKKLRLQSFARFSTYLPVVVIPSVVSMIIHNTRITNSILIQKYTCPVCMELKSALAQVCCGVLYPGMLAPVGALMMATRYHTYNVPYISDSPGAILNLYKKLTRPMFTPMLLLIAAQAIVASFVTYKENEEVLHIQETLYKNELEEY